MTNPYALTGWQRRKARENLALAVAEIARRTDLTGPITVAWNEAARLCHEADEIELGMILGLVATICRLGGDEGRDRALQAVAAVAAIYHTPEPDPRRN